MKYNKLFKRKLIPSERKLIYFPNANIGVVAKIKGSINKQQLINAIKKLTVLYPHLKVRIETDDENNKWFTNKGVNDSIIKEKRGNWLPIFLDEHKTRFNLTKGPLIRFIIVNSSEISDLIIICHHSICNLQSLSDLLQQILLYIDDPRKKPGETYYPPLPKIENFPSEASIGFLKKNIIKLYNKKWKKRDSNVDGEDVDSLHESFWSRYTYGVEIKNFSKRDTTEIIDLCHKHNITVTSALTTAFIAAKNKKIHKIEVTADLRNRLKIPAGKAFGFYVGEIRFKFRYKSNKNFWANAKKLNEKLKNSLKAKKQFEGMMIDNYLEPTFIDLMPFSVRTRSFRQSIAVSNIGKISFTTKNNSLELVNLIVFPSIALNTDIIIGISTLNNKMTLTLNYIKEKISDELARCILNKSISYIR